MVERALWPLHTYTPMTELDQILAAAFASEGGSKEANQFYLTFLQTRLFIPVKKEQPTNTEEPFTPLATLVADKIFILAFDTLARLKNWAGKELTKMRYVELSGRDLINGMNDQVYLALNVGEPLHKEFAPDEVKHLQKIIARIEQLKQN